MSEDGNGVDRRTVLQSIGVAGAFGLAGCSGGGGSGPTETESGPRTTDTESESSSTTAVTTTEASTTETKTDDGCQDLAAGVTLGRESDALTVTLNSLGDRTDSVVVRGCGDERTIAEVGGSTRVTECPKGSRLYVFAKGCGGVRTLLREFEVESAVGNPGRTAVHSVLRADGVDVTLTSRSAETASVELRGCADGQTLSSVGETTTVECADGETLKVVALDESGNQVSTQKHTVPDEVDLSNLTATIEYEQSGTEVTATLSEIGEGTERVKLVGCAKDATLTGVGDSVTVTTCKRDETIDALAVSADGRTQAVSQFRLDEVPSAQVTIAQDADGITVTADELGRTTTAIELGGCDRNGTISSEGESVTASGCSESPLTLTARHEKADPVVLAEHTFETTSSGDPPEVTINLTRNGKRVAVLVENTGPNVEVVEMKGCGGSLDTAGTLITNTDCGPDERVSLSVVTTD